MIVVNGNTPDALDFALCSELRTRRESRKGRRIAEIRRHTLDYLTGYVQQGRYGVQREVESYVKSQMVYGFWMILLPILIQIVIKLIMEWFFSSPEARNQAFAMLAVQRGER